MNYFANDLMRTKMNSLVNKKVLTKLNHFGQMGGYANEDIKKGEIICIFSGRIFDRQRYNSLPGEVQHYAMEIEEGLYLGAQSLDEVDEPDYLNHSCDPNLGIVGINILAAMRDIAKGEELTWDYAMSETFDDTMACKCGRNICRKLIKGTDWMLPQLQEKYGSFFSEYILRKIANLNKKD